MWAQKGWGRRYADDRAWKWEFYLSLFYFTVVIGFDLQER